MRTLLAIALVVTPLAFAIACGPSTPASAHATKPMDPADGAKDYDHNPAGPSDTKQPIPGPEKPTEPSASAMQPGQGGGK